MAVYLRMLICEILEWLVHKVAIVVIIDKNLHLSSHSIKLIQ